MKKLLPFAVLLAVAFPAARAQAPSSAASSADAAFTKFVDDYFAARFAARPTEGTAAGLHEYDSKMPDMSRKAVDARIVQLPDQLKTLTPVDPPQPSFA